MFPVKINNYQAPRSYPTTFLLPENALRVWEIEGACTTSELWQGWEPRWQVGTTEVDGSVRHIVRGARPVYWDGLDGSGFGYQFGWGWSSARQAQYEIPGPWNNWSPTTPIPGDYGERGGLHRLDLAYVRRCAWDALDANLREAVATDLAARACFSVTGNDTRQASLEKKAEAAVQLAIGSEGNQEGGQPQLAASIPQRLRNYSRF